MSHIQSGQRVFTVSAFLIRDTVDPQVLLRKHPKLGLWLQPGGHIEPDQDPIQALVVEFQDEVGIDLSPFLKSGGTYGRVTVLPLPAHMTVIKIPEGKPNPDDPEHFMVDLGYLVKAGNVQLFANGKEEFAWVRKTQLEDFNMPEDVRVFLKKHL